MILIVIQVVDQLTNYLIKIYLPLKRNLSFPCFYFLMFIQALKFFLVLIEDIFEASFLEVIYTKLLLGSLTFFILCWS